MTELESKNIQAVMSVVSIVAFVVLFRVILEAVVELAKLRR